jgi:hypothetical protein
MTLSAEMASNLLQTLLKRGAADGVGFGFHLLVNALLRRVQA